MAKRTQILPDARTLNLVYIVYQIAMGMCETQHGLETVELGVSVVNCNSFLFFIKQTNQLR